MNTDLSAHLHIERFVGWNAFEEHGNNALEDHPATPILARRTGVTLCDAGCRQ